jgi:hypothetical protein
MKTETSNCDMYFEAAPPSLKLLRPSAFGSTWAIPYGFESTKLASPIRAWLMCVGRMSWAPLSIKRFDRRVLQSSRGAGLKSSSAWRNSHRVRTSEMFFTNPHGCWENPPLKFATQAR